MFHIEYQLLSSAHILFHGMTCADHHQLIFNLTTVRWGETKHGGNLNTMYCALAIALSNII